MYTNMELWSEVRRRVLTGELSKRQACKRYKLHWDTLAKILRHEEPPGYRTKAPREKPVLGPYVAPIQEILEADRRAPKKQRHTAKRIVERLREKGYRGGRTVVQEEVRRQQQRSAEVFMPLVHRPGEAQADFGEATVVYRGQSRKVAMFVMSLPFSDALFCQIFPRECTETSQEGHRRAFEFFAAVPTRISYDNTKIAVSKVVQKRGGVFTREFLRLESHYLFAHHFCLVRRPNEKGHTENLVGYARRNFLVPVPELGDFEVFNEGLAEACRQDLQRQLRGKAGSKAELLEEDRRAMLPLPNRPFEARRVEVCQANSLSLVRFDRNDYSVPTQHAHHGVLAIGGVLGINGIPRETAGNGSTPSAPAACAPIVFADDSPLIRRMLDDALSQAGYEDRRGFSDGQEVWEYLEELARSRSPATIREVVASIVSDVEMPRMDGLTLTRRIRENPVLRDLPVVLFSSLISKDNEKKGRQVGATAQISKPRWEELTATLVDVLGQVFG